MPDWPDIPGPPDAHSPISRVVTDKAGSSWTVWEISPGQLPSKLRQLLGSDVEARGALLFVSETNEWRVLSPPPVKWLNSEEAELEGWLVRARVVRPSD